MVGRRVWLLLCGGLVLALPLSCGTAQEQDPASVVEAFYDAANEEDVDAFMALVADDAEIDWGREGLVTGKENIQRRAETLFRDFEFTFVLSDLQADGSRVTFNHKMVLDDTEAIMEVCADEVLVEGGQIKSSRLVSCEYAE